MMEISQYVISPKITTMMQKSEADWRNVILITVFAATNMGSKSINQPVYG